MAEELDRISHLSHVHIEGYKSIDNLDVDLLPGLNILIGKNGSGKSNFLEAISNIAYPDYYLKLRAGSSEFISKDLKKIEWSVSAKKKSNEVQSEYSPGTFNYDEKLQINGKEIYNSSTSHGDMYNLKIGGSINKNFYPSHLRLFLIDEKISSPLIAKVSFSLPENLSFLKTPGFVEFTDSTTESPESFLSEVFKMRFRHFWPQKGIGKNFLANNEIINSDKKEALQKYSPIKDIRLSENINLFQDEKRTRIDNIYFEFKVNNSWIPWAYLSDGTRRLFYLISQVSDYPFGIFFIEEPELGVHPHQFFDIMTFLKEESKNKQIIIATHSPEALNILGPDELDRIILTEYSPKKGTVMKHLNLGQKKKAKTYMRITGSLSDYWMHSDLEK